MTDTLFFLNDKKLYNIRYRAKLINYFSKSYKVRCYGLMDQPIMVFFILLLPFSNYICSNLKTNIFASLFFWRSGNLIVNGLGRFKHKKFFRWSLGFLFSINIFKSYAIQNYADYRYFKRFFKIRDMAWIPGSGGSKRKVGRTGHFGIVTRKDKLFTISKAMPEVKKLRLSRIYLVGCSLNDLESAQIDTSIFEPMGYVNQEDIFSRFDNLISFPGYGEGIPHTVVDALCSGMSAHLSKKDFISFGLHKLGFIKYDSFLDYVYIKGESSSLHFSNTNEKYSSFFKIDINLN